MLLFIKYVTASKVKNGGSLDNAKSPLLSPPIRRRQGCLDTVKLGGMHPDRNSRVKVI